MSSILPAEFIGTAKHDAGGCLTIGLPDDPSGQVEVNLNGFGSRKYPGWGGEVDVYVRRDSDDLSVIEVHMVRHSGIVEEEMAEQSRQGEIYPLGPKEYWRGVMVGKYFYGADRHLMTNEDFEEDWYDEEDGVD